MTADASAISRGVNPARRTMIGRVRDLLRGSLGPNAALFHAVAEKGLDFEVFVEDFDWNVCTDTTGPFATGQPNKFVYAESGAGAVNPVKLTPTRVKTSAMQLDTSAAALGQSVTLGEKKYFADANPFMEVGFWTTGVADCSFVIGWADAIPASAAPPVADIDTPSVTTMADCAVYAIDTSQTLKTAALVCRGTTGAAVTKTVVAPVGAPFGVPTDGAFTRIRVQLEGTGVQTAAATARLFINDYLAAENFAGPDSERLLVPIFYQMTPGGTGLVTQIDYVKVGMQKPGSPL